MANDVKPSKQQKRVYKERAESENGKWVWLNAEKTIAKTSH